MGMSPTKIQKIAELNDEVRARFNSDCRSVLNRAAKWYGVGAGSLVTASRYRCGAAVSQG